jgi:hypothetical protein
MKQGAFGFLSFARIAKLDRQRPMIALPAAGDLILDDIPSSPLRLSSCSGRMQLLDAGRAAQERKYRNYVIR